MGCSQGRVQVKGQYYSHYLHLAHILTPSQGKIVVGTQCARLLEIDEKSGAVEVCGVCSVFRPVHSMLILHISVSAYPNIK